MKRDVDDRRRLFKKKKKSTRGENLCDCLLASWIIVCYMSAVIAYFVRAKDFIKSLLSLIYLIIILSDTLQRDLIIKDLISVKKL